MKKFNTMKTIKNFIPIFILSIFLLGNTAFANDNTKINVLQNENIALTEETYVDDIPFDTGAVVAEANYQHAIQESFTMEDEKYIDDIPFDTRAIVCSAACEKAMSVHFPLEEESFIHDIPFNTALIVAVIKAQKELLAQQ